MNMDPSIWDKLAWDAFTPELPPSPEEQKAFIQQAYTSLWAPATEGVERRSFQYRAALFFQMYLCMSEEARKTAFTDDERKKIASEVTPAFENMRKEDLVFDRKPSKDNVLTRDKMELLSLHQKQDHFTFYAGQAEEDAPYAGKQLATLAKSLTDSERMYFAKVASKRLQGTIKEWGDAKKIEALRGFVRNLELTDGETTWLKGKYKVKDM